jgi:alanine dehydrogenase
LLLKLADQGYKKTLQENKNYLAGLNIYKGQVTYKGVSDAFNLEYSPAAEIISS